MHQKRIKLPIIMSILMLVVSLMPTHSVWAAEPGDQPEQPLLQFPVLSDIHIGEKKEEESFKRALANLKQTVPDYQAIALVGDITSYGKVGQYDDFFKILDNKTEPYYQNAEKIIGIGNHEYFDGVYLPDFTPEKYQKRFVEATGMPSLYYDKWINGYHFIMMGSEGFPAPDDDDHALISDQQYSWLETTLAENTDPEKPIFVFLHQAIDNTVYGSEEWGAGFPDNRLKTILKRYPQVILFTGHSHYIVNHPRTIYQDGFTMVNTGSVAYGWTDAGYIGKSQGLLVNVFSNRVEIKAKDFTTNSDIQTFTVSTPYKKTYGDNIKPAFRPGSTVMIDKNVSGDSVTLSFDAAWDNTLVDRYLIKESGKVIYTGYVNFWDNNVPQRPVFEINNLKPDTEYNWVISAVDAWNNESATLLNKWGELQISFKTSKLNGWKKENNMWVYYQEGTKITGWNWINGAWYLFSQDGSMYTGWFDNGVKKYYLNDDGSMQVGWKEIGGKKYYFGPDGDLQTGWVLDHNKWFYLDETGSQKLGWVLDKSTWYYLYPNGMAMGWLKDGNDWYYLKSSGAMQIGWIYNGWDWYYLKNSGAMATGWNYISNKWYYLLSSGEMQTGWIYEKGIWYYLKPDGAMQTGWAKINGSWYYFNDSGAMS